MMSSTMRKAIADTLEMWSKLDEWHRGREYENAKSHLEKWLQEDSIQK